MPSASKAFADQRREELFRHVPDSRPSAAEVSPPWLIMRNGELPPMMFQLRMAQGEQLSFAYSDLREVRFRDAGFLQLGVYGMSRLLITIEGRHLRELADALGCGLVRWLQVADERELDRPESSPCIDAISIEAFPNP